ncbi:hypothetical protein ALO97_05628, partial [Pseudomonas syringae pv. tagetis]
DRGIDHRQRSGTRLEHHFGPAVIACVEVLIGRRTFFKLQTVGNNLRWFGAVVVNQFGEAAVVSLDVGLTGADLLALEPERAEVEGHLAFFRQVVMGPWILRHEHADDTDSASRLGRGYKVVHGHVIGLMTMTVTALIAHAFATAVGAFAIGQIEDLIHCALLQRVDRRRAHFRRERQTVRVIIDHENLRRPLDHCRVRSHKANRASAINGYAFARQQTRQLGGMPTGRKDIREHDVVVFALGGVFRQQQAVEIGIRHAQQLGLSAFVVAHVGKPIGRPGTAGVGGQAITGQALFTIFAKAASNVERQAHPVANLDTVDTRADLNDLAQILVAENTPGLERRTTFVHVQVRATDVCGGHSDKSVCRLLYFRIRHVFDADVTRTAIDDGFHIGTLLK